MEIQHDLAAWIAGIVVIEDPFVRQHEGRVHEIINTSSIADS